MFSEGKHQRWDAANHIYMRDFKDEHGRDPTLKELSDYADHWMAENAQIATEWVLCPVCSEAIANGEPFKPISREDMRRLYEKGVDKRDEIY